MTKRTPPKIKQKIIADNRAGRYTHLQIGQKYGVSRQCVWAIVHRKKLAEQALPTPSKSDMITILKKVNLREIELQDIWGIICQGLRKEFSAIKINGWVYRL